MRRTELESGFYWWQELPGGPWEVVMVRYDFTWVMYQAGIHGRRVVSGTRGRFIGPIPEPEPEQPEVPSG